MLFDGCGTHATLGYLLPEFGLIFREVFDAALALLPEGSHFVTGTKLNSQVLPSAHIKKAHSYMFDLDREFLLGEFQDSYWLGEFFPSFDLVKFIGSTWDFAILKVEK